MNFPIRIFSLWGVLLFCSLADSQTKGQVIPIPDGAVTFPPSSPPSQTPPPSPDQSAQPTPPPPDQSAQPTSPPADQPSPLPHKTPRPITLDPLNPPPTAQPPPQSAPDQTELTPPPTPPPTEATNLVQCNDFQLFYDPLYPYGTWIITPYYGYVFQPFVAQGNWAPYKYGHWGHSDEGWTWQSDEPWGWATYHYGRWELRENLGWIWIPGRIWAPAWVTWRRGENNGQPFCGWAPLPPQPPVAETDGVGYVDEPVNADLNLAPECYHFIPEIYLGQRSYTPFYYGHESVENLIKNSKTITKITIAKRPASYRDDGGLSFHQVKAEGPDLSTIRSNEPIPEIHLTISRSKPGHVDTQETEGKHLAMMTPPTPDSDVPKTSHVAPIDGPLPLQIDRNISSQAIESNSNPQKVVTYQPSQAEIQARAQQAQALAQLHQEKVTEAKAQAVQQHKDTQRQSQGQ